MQHRAIVGRDVHERNACFGGDPQGTGWWSSSVVDRSALATACIKDAMAWAQECASPVGGTMRVCESGGLWRAFKTREAARGKRRELCDPRGSGRRCSLREMGAHASY